MWGRMAQKQPGAAAECPLWAAEEPRRVPAGPRSGVVAAIPRRQAKGLLVVTAALKAFSLPAARWEPVPQIQEIPEAAQWAAVQAAARIRSAGRAVQGAARDYPQRCPESTEWTQPRPAIDSDRWCKS